MYRISHQATRHSPRAPNNGAFCYEERIEARLVFGAMRSEREEYLRFNPSAGRSWLLLASRAASGTSTRGSVRQLRNEVLDVHKLTEVDDTALATADDLELGDREPSPGRRHTQQLT